MTFALTSLSCTVAPFLAATTSALRGGSLSGVLLLLAGAYVAWYGWFELRVLAGTAVEDPVVSTAIRVQAALSRSVAWLGVVGIAGIALAMMVVIGALTVRTSRRRHALKREEPQDVLP